MSKEKLIGAIVGIALAVLGSLGVLQADAVKQSICEQPAAQSVAK
jgi:hypothetical protein